MMAHLLDRREVLRLAGGLLLAGGLGDGSRLAAAGGGRPAAAGTGCVAGPPEAARVGGEVLAGGGNAVDAAVAAALTACVVSVQQCGIGGYGGHLVIAPAGGKRVVAIDFNSAAPQAARADLFPVDTEGRVKGQANRFGWRAAGVPGTLAGLQLALDRHGTRPLAQLVRPALAYARDGFPVSPGLARALRAAQAQLRQDPASARLFLHKGEPLPAGSTLRNPDLADLLQALAEAKTVEPFYRGEVARRIAAAFRKHGGLVTADDLAAYRAHAVEPLRLAWREATVYTAPLTAGGLTALQALATLKALRWETWPAREPRALRAPLEALRLAWGDRLRLLGDPERAKVPSERLLSEAYARQAAARVAAALKEGRPVPGAADGRPAGGTVHLSAADARGNLVALTLTHGEHFGARVTVPGLGLLLGHGMSRFDPRPGRPNSVGPGKRPLHNMCPTVVARGGQPVLALGGTGGRRIPNAVAGVLAQFVGRAASAEEAVAAPRFHTEGGLAVVLEARAGEAARDHLLKAGYTVTTGASASIHAVARDPRSGACRSASR
jgi:gamma-glutamyltranspeptidase / glutathione hydrolase